MFFQPWSLCPPKTEHFCPSEASVWVVSSGLVSMEKTYKKDRPMQCWTAKPDSSSPISSSSSSSSLSTSLSKLYLASLPSRSSVCSPIISAAASSLEPPPAVEALCSSLDCFPALSNIVLVSFFSVAFFRIYTSYEVSSSPLTSSVLPLEPSPAVGGTALRALLLALASFSHSLSVSLATLGDASCSLHSSFLKFFFGIVLAP